MRGRAVVIMLMFMALRSVRGDRSGADRAIPMLSVRCCGRLSNHDSASEGCALGGHRRNDGSATPVATASPSVTRPARAEVIRARLGQIPKEHQLLEDQRLAALVRFEFSRATQIQGQLQALDTEKATLERELAALPTAPSTPAAPPAAAAPPAPTSEVGRIQCQNMTAAVDNDSEDPAARAWRPRGADGRDTPYGPKGTEAG